VRLLPPIGNGEGYKVWSSCSRVSRCAAPPRSSICSERWGDVSGFKVSARGPEALIAHVLREIFLDFFLTSSDAEDIDIGKAIRLSEESYCPVWALLRNNVEIVTSHTKEKTR
jgi:putative redox protein